MIAAQRIAIAKWLQALLAQIHPGIADELEITDATNTAIPELGSAQVRFGTPVSESPAEVPYHRPSETAGKVLEVVREDGACPCVLEVRLPSPVDAPVDAVEILRTLRRRLFTEAGRDLAVTVGGDTLSAGELLHRERVDLWSVGDPVDVSALIGDAEWEARAELTMSVSYRVYETGDIDKIEELEITGSITY